MESLSDEKQSDTDKAGKDEDTDKDTGTDSQTRTQTTARASPNGLTKRVKTVK